MMKTNLKNLLKRMLTLSLVITLAFSVTNTTFAVEETWNAGEKLSFMPSSEDQTVASSEWTKNLVDLYQLEWYENPSREVLKGEFMLVQLRVIQAALERQGLATLSVENEILDFKDSNTLTAAVQEEAKILKSLGILSGTPEGYMALTNPIKRSEAAKVIASVNNKILKINSIRNPKVFTDTKGHWSERNISTAYQISLLNGMSRTTFSPDQSLTLEQTLQILENEIGYEGIRRVDVAKAMNETFNVTVNTDLSNNIIFQHSYVKYEEKMKTYGFDKLYDNLSAKSDEAVTKAEALKIALSVTRSTDALDGYSEEDEEYPGASWVNYAKMMGITQEEINITNYKDRATYIDVISYFEACKLLFQKDLPVNSVEVTLNDLSTYNAEEQLAIKDMVANKILYLLADQLNANDYIFKGQLNELAVNYAQQYNTIVEKGEQIEIDFKLNQTSAYPGDSFAVYVSNTQSTEDFSVTAPFYTSPIRFYKYNDGFIGLIPIYAWSTPGKYQIKFTNAQTKLLTTLDVEILPKTFDVQYLKVSKSTSALSTTDNSAKDQVYFDAARAYPIQEKLWEGAFIQPAKGRITTEYNATRYTNDNPTPRRHLAIDLANIIGTPILASNNGKVVLAKSLIISGNTIVIDHGMGVFTSSYHLSEIQVKEGDFVEKGDIIGEMGSTGYSTGSHLHFAIWKDGTFLNPWTFFEKDPFEINHIK